MLRLSAPVCSDSDAEKLYEYGESQAQTLGIREEGL